MMDGWERPAFRLRDAGMLVGGLAVLVLGAEGMVRGARGLALALGMSETLVGMTVVAIGTSVPELAASIVAARHGESDLAIGNVVGSNVFNATLILGTAALIHPIGETGRSNLLNMVFFIFSVFFVYLLMAIGHRLGRAKGLALLGLWMLSVILTAVSDLTSAIPVG
jgi:cation:H+ antiporter